MTNLSIIFLSLNRFVVFLLLPLFLGSCSMYISNSMDRFGQDFTKTISNHDDPETIAEALPAYLILMDSLASGKNAKPELISSAARVYTAYASLFIKDLQRQQRLSNKALKFAEIALCKAEKRYCNTTKLTYKEFTDILQNYDPDSIELLYTLGQAWAVWIQAHSTDWNAIAQLAQVKWIMESVVKNDETIDGGGAHLILGICNSLVPSVMGGKPEFAKQHFEKALLLSNFRNLSIKVALAEKYARLVFDQGLHDSLLNEVLSADPYQEGFVLVNVLAQQKASQLLASSTEYF